MFLSFFGITKLMKVVYNIIQVYMANRNICKRNLHISNQQILSWNKLSLREKGTFFDLWFLYNLCGHFIQLFTSISIISIHFIDFFP